MASDAIGSYQQAIAIFESLAKENPTVDSYRVRLARCLVNVGLLQETSAGDNCRCARFYRKAHEVNPDDAWANSNLAWLLATCVDERLRDPRRAVQYAIRATELAPEQADCWNTLGVAHYRAGNWQAALDALQKSIKVSGQADSSDMFFVALAHWQLGEVEEARRWYDKAVAQLVDDPSPDEELLRFRAEAEKTLKIMSDAPRHEAEPGEGPGSEQDIRRGTDSSHGR